MNMSVDDHKEGAPRRLRFSVITVSDRCSEGKAEDYSGSYIKEAVSSKNDLKDHRIVPDKTSEISRAVMELSRDVDCVVLTGGTGVSKRDVTIQAVRPFFEKEMPGFGELFRSLSYDEIGMASIMSGATAGIIGDSVIFCLPGSLPAVKLGMEIVLSEAYHIIKHLRE